MYISFAGIPSSELVKQGGSAAKFVTDFKTKYGHDPASFYPLYGVAATQVILAAIAKSDGTRKGVNDAVVLRASRSPPTSRSWARRSSIDPRPAT